MKKYTGVSETQKHFDLNTCRCCSCWESPKKKKEGEIDKELEPKLRKVEFQDVWKYDLSDSLAIRPFIYYFHSPPPLAEHFEKMRKDGENFWNNVSLCSDWKNQGGKDQENKSSQGKTNKIPNGSTYVEK